MSPAAPLHGHLLNWTLLADLYAIIKSTEKLERAYVRDGINAQEYESACEKLIAQYKVLYGSMKDMVSAHCRKLPLAMVLST